jgi:hypothetical protein
MLGAGGALQDYRAGKNGRYGQAARLLTVYTFKRPVPAYLSRRRLREHCAISQCSVMFDMEVIVRRQVREHYASVTCMIRHYVARRAKVIEDHTHNAE